MNSKFKKTVVSALMAAVLAAPMAFAEPTSVAPKKHSGFDFRNAALIPIQSGGRIKPLDSFARESALFITGSRSFEGWKPLELIFSWLTSPQAWETRKFVQIGRQDVKRQIGLEEKRSRFSPKELFDNSALLQYAQRMSAPAPGEKRGPREQELEHLLEKLSLYRSIVSGDAWTVVPSLKPNGTWKSLTGQKDNGRVIRAVFVETFRAYRDGDAAEFAKFSLLTRAAVEKEIPKWDAGSRRVLKAEVFYNSLRPFLLAWIFYLLAALTWVFARSSSAQASAKKNAKWKTRVALGITGLALVFHIVGFGLRCYIAGRPPVTNMYESIVWVSLGVTVFALILYWVQKQSITLLVSSVLAALGLIAADAAPAILDPGIRPLVPVLRSNYWLTIHVLTITLGYAAFALTLGLSNVTVFHFLRQKSAPGGQSLGVKIASMNQLTYRAMQFGVVLLAAGTILGGIWADYSWGRFWGWDPKETWALITLLCYLAILHARYTGWISQFGYAAWSIVAFLSVVMAWYGVNFVLGVGLHSYGFSTGGRGWVFGFVALQLAYVASAAIYRRLGRAGSGLGKKKIHSRAV